jgi:branched-chain amino acid transport system substrate-binding protein
MTLRHPARAVLCLLVAALLSACGTRLPDEAFSGQQVVTADGAVGDAGSGAGVRGASRGGATSSGQPAAGTGGPAADPTGDVAADDAAGGGDPGAQPGTAEGGGGGGASGPNQASDVGVTESTIRIGNITAENGVLGDTFAPAVRGLRAWVQATNAAGGINGRKVELFTCDDREDRARSLECARRLVEQDQVFALLATNSRALGGASQYLADKGVPVIGFPISNGFYRYPNMFTIYGAGYPRDGETVGRGGDIVTLTGQYRWYKQNLKVSKAAVFGYDISESSQAADQFVAALRAEGFDVTQYTVSFAAPSFDQAVADMQQRGTEIIFDAMDDGANRRLCDSMGRRNFKPKAKVSTVVVMGESIGRNYNETCRDIVHVSVEALPYSSGAAPVKEFRDAYARYQPGVPLHQWALEAWATGRIAADALRSMGPAPTRQGFVEHLNTMAPNTAGGIHVGLVFRPDAFDYASEVSKAPDCFGITRFQPGEGWVLVSDPFPFCYPDARNVATKAREQGN